MATSEEQNIDYLNLLNLVFKLGNHQIGKKVTDNNKWILDVEALTAKLFNHLGTILYLRKGTGIHLPNDEPLNRPIRIRTKPNRIKEGSVSIFKIFKRSYPSR